MSLTPKQNPFGDTSSWPNLVSALRAELAAAQERIAKLEAVRTAAASCIAVLDFCDDDVSTASEGPDIRKLRQALIDAVEV